MEVNNKNKSFIWVLHDAHDSLTEMRNDMNMSNIVSFVNKRKWLVLLGALILLFSVVSATLFAQLLKTTFYISDAYLSLILR